MSRNHFTGIVCFLLIFLFVYTAVSKLGDIPGFSADMQNQPLPAMLKNNLIWVLPASELLAAGLLVFDKTRLTGLFVSLILMLTFTLYVAMVLLNVFEYVPCSCGGVISSLSWWQHLVFNLFFSVLALIGILSFPVPGQFINIKQKLFRANKKEGS